MLAMNGSDSLPRLVARARPPITKRPSKVIDEIDPDKIIPIHTTNKQWFKEHFDNAAEVENGQVLAL